jgi:hypothetical protein
MGGMDENSVVNIPKTDRNFAVTLTDQSDVSMELERFSIDGQSFLTGKFGKSNISIGLEKIETVAFLSKGNEVKADVRLKDGQLVEIMVDKKNACFGVSSFANVRIGVSDIKKITIRIKK